MEKEEEEERKNKERHKKTRRRKRRRRWRERMRRRKRRRSRRKLRKVSAFLNLSYSCTESEWTESNLGKHKSLKRYKDNITQRS